MNDITYMKGLIYSTECRFDNIGDFFKYISEYIDKTKLDSKQASKKVNEIIERSREEADGCIDQQAALRLLVADDLERALECGKKIDSFDPEKELNEYKDQYYTLFSNFFGDSIDLPKLYIVDNFPSPYEKLKAEALAPDKADEEMYNIPQGLYFQKRYLAPYYSAYLLPHELVHSIVGRPNPYLLGRGLEEGIADLFGSIYGGMHVIGENVTKNITIYSRLSHTDPIWELYCDYLRQAACVYRLYGLTGIKELIVGGRDKIKGAEKKIMQGNLQLNLSSGDWDEDLNKLLDYLMSGYIKNLIVSPLAKYISSHISLGDDTKLFLKEHNIDEAQGNEAIQELQRNIFILLVSDKGSVDYFDDWISNSLRYKIPSRYI